MLDGILCRSNMQRVAVGLLIRPLLSRQSTHMYLESSEGHPKSLLNKPIGVMTFTWDSFRVKNKLRKGFANRNIQSSIFTKVMEKTQRHDAEQFNEDFHDAMFSCFENEDTMLLCLVNICLFAHVSADWRKLNGKFSAVVELHDWQINLFYFYAE